MQAKPRKPRRTALASPTLWHGVHPLLAAAVSLVPLLGVVVLLIANAQASAHLRGAGYQVGLIGVRKRK